MSGITARGSLVVITGAGSGIGAATAIRYAQDGSTVVAVDIDETSAKEIAEQCRRWSPRSSSHQCDVADAYAVQTLADAVADQHGAIDILVNNAGVGVGGPFLDTTADDWEWLRSINIDGVLHGFRSFGQAMVRRRHGQIVNIASGAAYMPNHRMATYCASKAAVVMFSRCMRAEWRRHNVGVSVVCPGVINTPILSHTRLRGSVVDEKDRLARAFKLGHKPDSVAKAVTKVAERNRAMASVGVEARVAYHALRLLPPLNTLVAKL
jgi:2-hydroxycyclohexanecarboxyl-CoA dehydrogenase